MFITITICIVATMMLLSSVLYINFENIVQNQVYSYSLDSLAQTSVDASIMTETAKKLSYQVFVDLSISKLLFYSSHDIYDIGPAISQLGYYQLSMPFIESIYIYNGKNNTFFIKSSGRRPGQVSWSEMDDKDILKILNNYRAHPPFQPIPRQYTINSSEETSYSCYTYIYYDMLTSYDSLESAVIINISETWLHSLIDASSKSLDGENYIVDKNGVLLSTSRNYPMLTNLSSKGFVNKVISNSASSGYFTDTINNSKFLVTFTSPDKLGWRYIRLTPYNTVSQRIDSLRKRTFLIIIIVLFIGLLSAFVVSRRLYLPILEAFSKIRVLEYERRKNLPNIKQEFLKNNLLGNEISSSSTLYTKFKELEINILPDKKAVLILFRIDSYSDFLNKYPLKEQNTYKYAISNITFELCEDLPGKEVIDMGEDKISVIAAIDDYYINNCFDYISNIAKKIQSAVLTHLEISLSAFISPVVSSFNEINTAYSQLLEASLHRLFYGHSCIINSELIALYKLKEYVYDYDREKMMVEALMSGKPEEAKALYLDIINATRTYSYAVVNYVVSHLVFTVSNTINIIQKNNCFTPPLLFNPLVPALNNMEVIEDINKYFLTTFDEVGKRLEGKRCLRHELLIQEITSFINNNYMDSNLCLNSIADNFHLHPVYVGRLYKQYSFVNIPDFITQTRIARSKGLLRETDLSIAEIAEKVGFSNSSYFYKTFKKECTVTPTEFRKIAVKELRVN